MIIELQPVFGRKHLTDQVATEVDTALIPVTEAICAIEENTIAGFNAQEERNKSLMRRHGLLHGKVDQTITLLSKLSEKLLQSPATTTPIDSQRIIDSISPALQHTVSTAVLQQVSSEVHRVMSQYLLPSTYGPDGHIIDVVHIPIYRYPTQQGSP